MNVMRVDEQCYDEIEVVMSRVRQFHSSRKVLHVRSIRPDFTQIASCKWCEFFVDEKLQVAI
jgi:hypothetical protein